ncbi:MAG: anthranilate synthase component I [Candidatus Omnitrophica bacterium]|nr:anthranilate synthase component I [Candidatus Omnitrophota bacterium]
MRQITEKQFLEYSKQGNLIPVFKEIFGDLETPVSAYMKLAGNSPYSFLLESVEGSEKLARYSLLSSAPEFIFRTKGHKAEILRKAKNGFKAEERIFQRTPLEIIRELLTPYNFVNIPGLPQFCGGLVGYMSYDTVRFFENLPNTLPDVLDLPDIVFMMAKDLVVFDHVHHTILVISCVEVPEKASRAERVRLYHLAMKKNDAVIRDLGKPLVKQPVKANAAFKVKVGSNCTKARYEGMIERAKEEIRAGEIIQVVLSQRFEAKIDVDPVTVYRTLRTLNPSPYMYLLNLDGFQVVGSSPELLVRVENGIVETCPIAGTKPRGKTPEADAAFEKELLSDPKERAEHVMLVDLGRNDLGRVCKEGSVRVTDLMSVERYSHVMHIVSTVQGVLKPEYDAIAALESTFPAGTLSGAPKVRAMEIIEALEPTKRGPYGGCVGYISFSKNLNTCITIRTLLIKGKKAYIQSGAGIVADSDPSKEYEESLNKAMAQVKALECAHTR